MVEGARASRDVERPGENVEARSVALDERDVREVCGAQACLLEQLGRFGVFVIRIDADRAGGTRDEYQRLLAEENIATSIHFLPVHRLRWFSERLPEQRPLPVAERAGEEVLSLPLSPVHSDDEIRDVVEAIRALHSRLTR